MSTLDRMKRAEEVFLEVAALPAAEWEAAIAARCAGDEPLATEVRALLECHAQASGFLNEAELMRTTLGFVARRGDWDEGELTPGATVGEYVIEGILGVGGMGTVYIARQDRPRRTVALKVIRRGYSSPSLVRRFEHEAEVLGRLHHPGIAQIFEAGSAIIGSGRAPQPFIAMELVNGPPLHDFVEQHALSTADKLELFARVCDAVHYAHQRGVIHRDLKPGNILVDEHGQPKVLDFGVARAADADLRVTTLQTSVGQLIGTLPYMSPEQVLAEPSEVDTRSDVYALGVILYQLLTGRLPLKLESRSIPEAARIIREESPSRLSSVSKVFRGDVETIVSKAMEKDKARRYQSAADLRDDLRRYLAGQPIAAKQDSAVYVLLKQIRRHRVVATVAAALLLSVLSFLVYATVQAGRYSRLAERESDAKRRAQQAGAAAEAEAARANEQASRLEEQLYFSNIERGRLEGLAGNVSLSEDALWKAYLARPTSPGARWALWELYQRHPCMATLQAFPARATGVAFSPDGAFVVAAGPAGEMALFEGAGRRELARWKSGVDECDEVRFRNGSRELIAAGRAGVVERWTLERGEDGLIVPHLVEGSRFAPAGQVDRERVVIAPSGDLLAINVRGAGVQVFEATTGGLLATLAPPDKEAMFCGAFSVSGDRLAIGTTPGTVHVWDWKAGKVEQRLRVSDTTIFSVAFSNDAARVIVGGRDRRISVYDVGTGALVGAMAPDLESTRRLDVSPDGTTLLSAGRGAIHVWDLASGRLLGEFGGHRDRINDGVWSADGRRFASVASDGLLKIWSFTGVPATRSYEGNDGWVFDCAFSPDRRYLASAGGDGTVRVWTRDGPLARTIKLTEGRLRAVRFSADGSRLFVGGSPGVVHVLHAPQFDVEATIPLSTPAREVGVLTLSPDGGTLLAGTYGPRTALIDTRTLARTGDLLLPRPGPGASAVCVSLDGATAYTNGTGREVLVWDLPTRTVRATWPVQDAVLAMALDREGNRLAVGSGGGRIEILDGATGRALRTLDAHVAAVYAMDFSPSGRVLASGADDGTIKLWEPARGELLATMRVRKGEVPSVRFSPDGHLLGATFQNRACFTWDLLEYNRFVAGNMAYQLDRLRDQLEPGTDLTPALQWRDAMLAEEPR